MECEKVTSEAEKHSIIKPTIELQPEIMLRKDAHDNIKETYSDIIPDQFNSEYLYIRKVNDHIEIGPANIEYKQ